MSLKSLSIFLIFALIHPSVRADPSEDERKALISLRDAVGGRLKLWNVSQSPCDWDGVFCTKSKDSVYALRFPGMGLTGQLPSGLAALKKLQILSLRFNSLTGTLPSDLQNLTGSLRSIYVQGNSLSGPIPPFLFELKNLIRLSLARNKLSGDIPDDFAKLPRLLSLYLEDNQFTGSIPTSDLSSLAHFNIANNKLKGKIPNWATKFNATSFEGNRLCGPPLSSCKKKLSAGAIAGIVIASVLVLLLLLAILFFLLSKRKGSKNGTVAAEKAVPPVTETPREKPAPPEAGPSASAAVVNAQEVKGAVKSLVFFGHVAKRFELEDLLRASAEVLGKGTFGTTYKANLDSGNVVAVKRLKEASASEDVFAEKLASVGKMAHPNLVPLRAYYHGREERLLVYDYLPMGSLSSLLHGNSRTPLNWESRARIAVSAARGIEYIHSQGGTVSHGNVKASNILLAPGYESRVSDYCLAQLALPTPTPNRVDGYRAPEVTDTRRVTQKGDVYSFGVVVLELLTGKAPTQAVAGEEGVDLPRWVQSVVREKWTAEVFDMELLRDQDVEDNMVEMLQLAVDCTALYPDSRPAIADVRRRMDEICRSDVDGIVNDDVS